MRHSPTGQAGITFGIAYMGATGTTYPDVPVYDWVKYMNVDQLDGAHALTTSTPWSIPVSLSDGKLHPDWIRADAIRKTFCQANHGFAKGHVLRFDTDGSLTFAKADTVENAEAIGIVESVTGSCFSIVTKGFISGLTATGGLASLYPLVTGNAYFLSPDVRGGLIINPDSGAYMIQPGEVRKSILVANGIGSGYVINYTGIVVGDNPTDEVYLRSAAPIGSVHPFAGPTAGIPEGWLLCDGAVKEQGEWSDLYATIGLRHYAIATVNDSSTITLEGDTRGIASGDALTVTWPTGSADIIVQSVNTTTRRVVATTAAFSTLDANTSVKVYGRTVASTVGRSVFFLPDLRRRTVFGTSSEYSSLSPSLALGGVGGQNAITLLPSNIPQHTHGLDAKVPSDPFGAANASSTDQTGEFEETGNAPTSFDTMPPYVTMHWIIRANKGFQATILTGHNHDNFYIRYDIPHTTAAGAARTLTDSDRIQFRSNAKVLRNDADDTFRGTLTITGNLFVQGVGGDTVDATIVGGMSADYINTNRAYINQSAVVNLASAQLLNITGGSNTTVKMYPALNYGLTGATKTYDQTKRSANSRNLVVDHSTGEVSVRPLHTVSENAPPTSTSGYPEGFVWYQTGTGVETDSLAATNGYVVLPGGILMQWGTVTTPSGNDNRVAVTFPKPFSATPWSVTVTPKNHQSDPAGTWSSGSFDYSGQYQLPTATGMYVIAQASSGDVANVVKTLSWIAIGKL
jgi:microcystin-dependent protein